MALGNLNDVAFQVPHVKVVRALPILLSPSDIDAPRTQDLPRLSDVGGVEHWRRPISRLALRPEDGDAGLILLGEAQRDTPLRVVHFRRNLLEPQLLDVPRSRRLNIQHSNVERIGDSQQRHGWI